MNRIETKGKASQPDVARRASRSLAMELQDAVRSLCFVREMSTFLNGRHTVLD
jgi:hypothetical protein